MKILLMIAVLVTLCQRADAQRAAADTSTTVERIIAEAAPPLISGEYKDTVVVKDDVPTEVYTMVDEPAQFDGDLNTYLREKLVYPTNAREKELSGRVIVKVIIDADGTVLNPVVMRSAGDAELDAEATRVIRSMPKWKPGKLQGKVVATYYILPVVFAHK